MARIHRAKQPERRELHRDSELERSIEGPPQVEG